MLGTMVRPPRAPEVSQGSKKHLWGFPHSRTVRAAGSRAPGRYGPALEAGPQSLHGVPSAFDGLASRRTRLGVVAAPGRRRVRRRWGTGPAEALGHALGRRCAAAQTVRGHVGTCLMSQGTSTLTFGN